MAAQDVICRGRPIFKSSQCRIRRDVSRHANTIIRSNYLNHVAVPAAAAAAAAASAATAATPTVATQVDHALALDLG